jgi:membrane peptidoglycan carboxypeptidase
MPRSERLPAHRVLSHLVVMAAVSVVLGVVVAGLAIPFAGLAGLGTRNLADTMEELPQELTTEELPQRSLVLDNQGEVLATLYVDGGNRVNVPLRHVSRIMVKALVAIEDYRFYEHGPLDFKGTLRAMITNQANDGVVQGGSTITQQLVKLTLIQQADTPEEQAAASDDTYARKFNELRYAAALEENYSKDWILERYLNTAYFGDGVYGIQMAAKHYFGVNAAELKARQAALLAGMVKNPTEYDPTNSEDKALARRDVVLDRMAELNVISREKADRLKQQDLGLNVQESRNGCVRTDAPFFCDYVLDWLSKDTRLGATPEDRMHLLQTGGLSIRTTVDVGMQATADNAVRAHVFQRDQAIGALAVVEPGTGNVKAIAQSRPMGRNKRAGETYLNYVVPQKFGDSQCCQAGSTFKVFTLAAALEQGVPLDKVYNAPASMSFNPSDFASCPGSEQGGSPFTIDNSTSSGRMNLYSGTRLSVNTFYMQLTRETGICKPYEMAKSMGVDLTSPNGDRQGNGAELVPSFTLGVAPVSPLEMAEAYATFAARGLHCHSRPVEAILDSAGNQIRDYASNCSQVMQQRTADAVNDVLRGVIEGGFASAQALDQPAAGKTGTTQEGKSVWFVGYTPQLAAAAMIGGANALGVPIGLAGQTIGGQYVPSASGSGFAAPIWGDAMKVYDNFLGFQDFVYPSTVPGAGETVAGPPPCKHRCGGGGDGGGGGGGGRGYGGGGSGGGGGYGGGGGGSGRRGW